MVISLVRKRNGSVVKFDSLKIQRAIEKAMLQVGELDKKEAGKITSQIVKELSENQSMFFQGTPTVEQIQDKVEEVLSKTKFTRTAKAFMLYRRSRKDARNIKEFFGIKDDMKFDVNAIRVLQERYLLKDEDGKIIETPTQLFRRVAKAMASVEKKNKKEYEERFFGIMTRLEFLPNSPTLMNAGTKFGQLSACYVLPVEDSLTSIFKTLEYAALIQQTGGGTGFNFSHIRPRGDIVRSTKGVASGPISFIRIFNQMTETIKQGGKRRGANMGILNVNHPDILEFIEVKQKGKELNNYNISVGVDDKFMEAVINEKDYDLINPRTHKTVQRINARLLFDFICHGAWDTGDPGMIFLDEINRKSQVRQVGEIEATNPCGEVPLLPYESCNLGSINLTKVVEKGKIDWEKLKDLVWLSTRFLDNVIDANVYQFPELDKMAKDNRRIGLGVMGFAEALILLGIPYDSKNALKVGEKMMKFINEESHKASMHLAKERGSFPNFNKSAWKGKVKMMRNCACTTIAPTGTISIIAGCSSGIEPLFAIAFMREVLSRKHLFEANKIFQQIAIKERFYSDELMKKIAMGGNLRGVRVPNRIKSLFKTALEISPEQHIMIQAAFQRHTDNAVSKTINLPGSATEEDIRKAYRLSYKMKCKGITIYRYGSKSEQVLYLGEGKKMTHAGGDYTGGTCIGNVCSF